MPRQRRRLTLQGALVALLAAIGFAGCGIVPSPTAPQPSLAIHVQLPDGVAGLARSDGQLSLMLPVSGGGVSAATSATDRPGKTAVHLLTRGGDTGTTTNTFVFGNAPIGATSIEVQPGGAVGVVQGGLFLVGLAQKDQVPSNLTWRFLNSAGAVIETGTGITG
jgi:hypothetical protein